MRRGRVSSLHRVRNRRSPERSAIPFADRLAERRKYLAASCERDRRGDGERVEARVVTRSDPLDERSGAREVDHVGRQRHRKIVKRLEHLIGEQLAIDELHSLLRGGTLECDAEQRLHEPHDDCRSTSLATMPSA